MTGVRSKVTLACGISCINFGREKEVQGLWWVGYFLYALPVPFLRQFCPIRAATLQSLHLGASTVRGWRNP